MERGGEASGLVKVDAIMVPKIAAAYRAAHLTCSGAHSSAVELQNEFRRRPTFASKIWGSIAAETVLLRVAASLELKVGKELQVG